MGYSEGYVQSCDCHFPCVNAEELYAWRSLYKIHRATNDMPMHRTQFQ